MFVLQKYEKYIFKIFVAFPNSIPAFLVQSLNVKIWQIISHFADFINFKIFTFMVQQMLYNQNA